jgi:hypothetical protein
MGLMLSEEDQSKLYLALLRGFAKEAQDRACAEDRDHEWGRVEARDHWPDIPFAPGRAIPASVKIARSYHRQCLNCGKAEILKNA